MLGLVPSRSEIANTIRASGGGFVADPIDITAINLGITRLSEPEERIRLGSAIRSWAETTMNQERVADQFEGILHAVVHRPL